MLASDSYTALVHYFCESSWLWGLSEIVYGLKMHHGLYKITDLDISDFIELNIKNFSELSEDLLLPVSHRNFYIFVQFFEKCNCAGFFPELLD